MALLLAYGNIASGLPRVSYLRALDIWMTVCMLLTFLTLLEFAVVGFLEKKRTRLLESKKQSPHGPSNGVAGPATPASTSMVDTLGSSIDAVAAKAFPLMFLAFNIAYWTYYLHSYFSL